MTDKLFDAFIKGKMQQATAPVSEELWDKIIAQHEKERRGIWWFNNKLFWVAVAFLFLGGLGFFATKNQSYFKGKNDLVSKQDKEQITNEGKLNNVENENLPITSSSTTKEENLYDKKVDNLNAQTSKDELLEKSSITYSGVNAKAAKNLPFKTNEIGLVKTNKSLNLKITKEKENRFSNFLNGSFGKSTVNASEINDEPLSWQTFSFKPGVTAPLSKNILANKIATNPFPINMRKLLGLNGEECGNYTPKIIYVEAYASADYSQKRITNIDATNNYLRRKDSAEQEQMGFTTGVRFSKNLTENWFIKAGLQFSQINEIFSNRTENERRQTIVITTRTLIRMGLPDTTISDTSSLIQIGYKTVRTQNRYSSLEVPILISYETGNSESNWKFAITGGLIINATTWYSGKTYDENFNVVSLKESNNGAGFYNHQLGFSAYLSGSIYKKLTPNFSLFVEPYYRVGINKNNISAGFTQQFNTMGATIGLRYKLNK